MTATSSLRHGCMKLAVVLLSAVIPTRLAHGQVRTVVVLEFAPQVGSVSASTARVLTDVVRAKAADELSATGIRVVSRDIIDQTLAELEKRGEKCDLGVCDAEIAGNLGASHYVAGEVAKVGKVLVVTIRLSRQADNTLLGSRVVRAKSEEELLDSLDEPAAALMAIIAPRESPVREIERVTPEVPPGPKIEVRPRLALVNRETGAPLKEVDIRQGMSESVGLEFLTSFTAYDVNILGAGGDDFQLEVQYRTVYSIAAEGPRINLDGWKSSSTEWQRLPKREIADGVSFSLAEYPKNLPFPEFKRAELEAELTRRGEGGWIAALKDPYVGRGAAVDRVLLRVSSRAGRAAGAPFKQLGIVTVTPNLEE